jgi:enoyl-CoA hydratase/carnithine racemase
MSGLTYTVNEKGVAVVTFDVPPMNLFDYSIYDAFGSVFNELSGREDVFVVILRAAGKNFSCGNVVQDLAKVNHDTIDRHYKIVGEGLSAIYTCKKPTVCAVQGMAIGAGLAAPACCDIIIAADDASFFVPEITVGIIGASEFLQMMVPKKIARYYAYTGKPIPAYKMLQYGGVLDLYPRKELDKEAMRIAEELTSRSSPIALSCFKQYMNDNENDRLYEKFLQGKVYGKEWTLTADYAECTKAFFEKRKPNYTGKR